MFSDFPEFREIPDAPWTPEIPEVPGIPEITWVRFFAGCYQGLKRREIYLVREISTLVVQFSLISIVSDGNTS